MAIVAVIVAAAFAVAANLGILSASSDARVGGLAAAGDLVSPTSPAGSASTTTSPTPNVAQTYLVDAAGSVTVAETGPLALLSVSVNPGWTWRAGPSDPRHVDVTFSDGVRTLVFSAARSVDGIVNADVQETATDAATSPAATSAPTGHDDDHSDDHNDDHDVHEGRDDDD
jgi:hypothetical protein